KGTRMKECDSCGSSLPTQAIFCGECGKTVSQSIHSSNLPTMPLSDIHARVELPGPHFQQGIPPSTRHIPRPIMLLPLQENRHESQDYQQRAAMADMSPSLLEQMANHPQSTPPPVIPLIPQVPHLPITLERDSLRLSQSLS
ncbi:MAG TPA: zinc ribbon domain-containing protein, partial [Ktedonobacteraceae bacterium]